MVASIISLFVGSIITWLVTHWYYSRSKDDFSVLISKIDQFIKKQNSTNYQQTDAKHIKFIDILGDTDTIGEAILSYARNSGAEMDSVESGIPIYALNELIGRIDRIKESLRSYRDWRVHLGA